MSENITNQQILDLVATKKQEFEQLSIGHYGETVEFQNARDLAISKCDELILWAENEYKKITDKIFVSQAKRIKENPDSLTFESDEEIDDVCAKYSHDIETIVGSRTPAWLANAYYKINKDYRKKIYERIIKNYVIICNYAENQKEIIKNSCEMKIQNSYNDYKNLILASFDDFKAQLVEFIEL